MRHSAWIVAAGLVVSMGFVSNASAGQCEDSFVKKGSMLSGLRFTATISVPDMPPAVAINQLRGLTAAKGYTIIASEPESGALLIEQPVTQMTRAFPIEINATQSGGVGTVVMEAKMRAGQSTKAELAQAQMCGVLAQLKGGKAGRQAASSGANAMTKQAAPTAMTAQAFASQISKDAERNVTSIPVRYKNQQFTLSGEVDYLRPDSGTTRVAFKILQAYEMVMRLPGMPERISQVSCLMAPGTSVYTMQLKPKKQVKLTGTFMDYDDYKHATWFKDCRPATGN